MSTYEKLMLRLLYSILRRVTYATMNTAAHIEDKKLLDEVREALKETR